MYCNSSSYQLDGSNAIVTGVVKNGEKLNNYDREGKRQSGWMQTNHRWGYLVNGALLKGISTSSKLSPEWTQP